MKPFKEVFRLLEEFKDRCDPNPANPAEDAQNNQIKQSEALTPYE